MNGRLIVELLTSLSASIISEWVSVKDRVRLDSAHCQASVREEFLQLNRSAELSVKSWSHDHKSQANRALVSWASMREVYIEKLLVETEGNLDLYSSFMQKFGSRVFALCWDCFGSASLAQIAVACENLLVLKLHNRKLSASLCDVFVCCKRLREFSSFGHSFYPAPADPPLTSAHLHNLVCDNLKYLELIHCDADLVAAFLRMAVAVEAVVLKTNNVSLNGIQESTSLSASTLSFTQITLDAGLATFAHRGEQLENLCFPCCYVTDTAISVLRKFPNLRALDLSNAIVESEYTLSVLASSCGNILTELLLHGCRPMRFLDQLQQILPQFPQLTSFSFCLEDHDPPAWNMSSFGGLAKLQIYYSGYKMDRLFGQLTEHCYVNIRELSLNLYLRTSISEEVNLLVSTCANLRNLNLYNTRTGEQWYTEEEKERWLNQRPSLTIGGRTDHRLNVFDKYGCSDAW